MLKRKVEVNYRKAVTTRDGRFARCKCCMNRTLMESEVRSQKTTLKDWRCPVIGLGSSRKYAVEADHVCDEVKVIAAETLERLRAQL